MNRHISRRGRLPRVLIAVLAGLNAVSALAGALGLAIGFLSLSEELTARLPWGSPVLGGIALGLLVALPNGLLTLLAVRVDRQTGACAIAVGVVLVGWILVQLAFIREVSFFHPLYAGLGLLLVWLGTRLRLADHVEATASTPTSKEATT